MCEPKERKKNLEERRNLVAHLACWKFMLNVVWLFLRVQEASYHLKYKVPCYRTSNDQWPVSVSLKLIEVPLDGIVRLHSDSGSSVHSHKKLERRGIVYSKSYHHRISSEEQIHEEPLEPSVEFIGDK